MQLAPRLLVYPAWKVEVDGQEARYKAQPTTMQMVTPLPAGNHRVEIHFTRTWDRTTGAAISLATAAALLGFAIKRRPIVGSANL